MWYNRTNMQKPDSATNTSGAANLVRRLTCLLYHKGASVLIAASGSRRASLSVSQDTPISYGLGVRLARPLISSATVIKRLSGYVLAVARNINAGMQRVNIAHRVARRAALQTWNKACQCSLCVRAADGKGSRIVGGGAFVPSSVTTGIDGFLNSKRMF